VTFQFNKRSDGELRLANGDELKVSYLGDGVNKPWNCNGNVVRIEAQNEEITLELRSNAGCPIDQTFGFIIDFVWKSTSFDRMQLAMKTFAVDEFSVTGYLYHLLLGHDVEPQDIRTSLPSKITVCVWKCVCVCACVLCICALSPRDNGFNFRSNSSI
jgi:regulator of nonsense transcripts 1